MVEVAIFSLLWIRRYSFCAILFFLISLDKNTLFSFPKTSLSTSSPSPLVFFAQSLFSSSGMVSFLFFYHAFHSFKPRFLGFLKIFGVFSKLMRFL